MKAIGIIGGTGRLGSGLARLWSAAGYRVTIGSRSKEKAETAAHALSANGRTVWGEENRGAARSSDIVVLAVPYAAHDAMVDEIRPGVIGKILVDAVVPLVPPHVAVVQLPASGSPGIVAQRILGPDVRVVSAFHNVSSTKLQSGEKADCDVLVFGEDASARGEIVELAAAVGGRGIDGGCLANSVAAEALTSILIGLNMQYRIPATGIRFTGLPPV